MTESRHGWRLFLRIGAVVLALLAIAYFARELVRYWPTIAAISFTPAVAGALVAAALLHVFSGILNGWSWGWLLRGFYCRALARRPRHFPRLAVREVRAGQRHTARVAHCACQGVRLANRTVLLSMVVENGFALGAGALVAGASLAFGLSENAGGLARAGSTCARPVRVARRRRDVARALGAAARLARALARAGKAGLSGKIGSRLPRRSRREPRLARRSPRAGGRGSRGGASESSGAWRLPVSRAGLRVHRAWRSGGLRRA